jgi:putative membrane protein
MKRASLLLAGLVWAGVAQAHVPGAAIQKPQYVVISLLGVAALLYLRGLFLLWPHVHARQQLLSRALLFFLGWLALCLALLSPLDTFAAESFALHMIQHESLMLVAAPLLVLGRGLPTFLWALPHDARRLAGKTTRSKGLKTVWNAVSSARSAWFLHAAALWLWHLPVFFNAALAHPALHEWQHVSFLLTALLFWHALFRHGTHAARGMAVLYLFTTTLHTGLLGALLTFARAPLYGGLDRGLSHYWGLTALEDQQLGGLIMWVPAATIYVGAALVLTARWIADTGERPAESRR